MYSTIISAEQNPNAVTFLGFADNGNMNFEGTPEACLDYAADRGIAPEKEIAGGYEMVTLDYKDAGTLMMVSDTLWTLSMPCEVVTFDAMTIQRVSAD